MKQVKSCTTVIQSCDVKTGAICLAVSQLGVSIYYLCRVVSASQDSRCNEYAFVSLATSGCWAAGAQKTVELAINAVLSTSCNVYVFKSVKEMAEFIVEHS